MIRLSKLAVKGNCIRLFGSVRATHVPKRESMLRNAKSSQTEYDVLVIGGGSTGCGSALDARLRGLKVACVEREDFASATSSRSTQLLWGGSRYLVQALVALFNFDLRLFRSPAATIKKFRSDLKLVMNCHRERKFLLKFQPHLTSWLPIAVPLSKWIQWPPPYGFPPAAFGPLGLYPFFFKIYDALSGFTCPPSHIMTRSRARRKFPQLANSEIKYCPVFYEGQHNDARTNLAIGMTAALYGADMLNYCEVVKFIYENDDSEGKVTGAIVRDTLTGESFPIRAKSVLICAGVFTDELRRLKSPTCKSAVEGASGVHIVLPSYYAPSGFGLVDMNTSDGRFLFFLPWQGHVLVGTTDHQCAPTTRPVPMESEIQWILTEAAKYLSPELRLRRQDVLSAWKGIRPLATDPNTTSTSNSVEETSQASRDHVISVDKKSNVVFIAGGKWTTYREMAEDAIDTIIETGGLNSHGKVKPCSTLSTALIGKEGYSENLPVRLIQEYGISLPVAQRLSKTYGGRAWEVLSTNINDLTASSLAQSCEIVFETKTILESEESTPKTVQIPVVTCPDPTQQFPLLSPEYPFLEIEVIYAIRHEWAVHAEDILARRTRLAFLNKNAAIRAIPRVVELMAGELGWDKDQQQAEIHRCVDFMQQFGGPVPASLEPQTEEVSSSGRKIPVPNRVRMATNEDIRQVMKVVDPQAKNSLSWVDIELAAEMLGHSLTKDAIRDSLLSNHPSLKAEDVPTTTDGLLPSNITITQNQFSTWWNSDRHNKGLQVIRDRHIKPLQNVRGSGTFFG